MVPSSFTLMRRTGSMRIVAAALACVLCSSAAFGQSVAERKQPEDKFRQLEETLPTPNTYRTASGAPGNAYWQQRADYAIDVTLDDAKQRIVGSETVTYHNNSPDAL